MRRSSLGRAYWKGTQGFFTNALRSLPRVKFAITDTTCSSDAALVHWTAESDAGRIDDGVDTFVSRDGDIRLHAVHFTVKQAG